MFVLDSPKWQFLAQQMFRNIQQRNEWHILSGICHSKMNIKEQPYLNTGGYEMLKIFKG